MDFGTAMRRGSVHLKSLGSSHRHLNIIISQLRETKDAFKTYIRANERAAQDINKWGNSGENQALQDVCFHISDLITYWTDIQREYAGCLKEFRHQFERILEGEKQTTKAKENLSTCDQKRIKLKKDLQKASKKSNEVGVTDLTQRIEEAERATSLAHLEVNEVSKENEVVKVIRMKQAFMRMADANISLGHKCQIVFEAQREIANELPSITHEDIHQIRYRGYESTKRSVLRAKERVQRIPVQQGAYSPSAPPTDAPPPYTSPSPSSCRSVNEYQPWNSNTPGTAWTSPHHHSSTSYVSASPSHSNHESCVVCPTG